MTISRRVQVFIALKFFLLSVLFLSNSVFAQITSSPYSRYGVGDVSAKGFGQNFALGGTYVGLQNDTTAMFFINNGNPASYANMRLVTAELGANYVRTELESASAKKTINNASLGYIALAFPFKKWWGASMGLIPYSSVGYKISDEQDIANIGNVKFLYEGTGGINQVYFGNGIRPFYGIARKYQLSSKYRALKSVKNADNVAKSCMELFADNQKIRKSLNRRKFVESIALGANASYLFGNMENSRRSIFPSSLFAFNTKVGTNTRVDGFYLDYGMQMAYTVDSIKTHEKADSCHPYRFRDLKENVKFVFGATFSAETAIDATIDSVSYSYFNNSLGYEIVKDTIDNTKGKKGKVVLPMSFGVGFAIKKGEKLTIGADVAIQNWADYSAFDKTQGMKNSMRTSLGIQYIPDSKPNAKYFKRCHYRIGGKYTQTALELKSTQLTEISGTVGIGFPVGRSYILQNFSMVNIGVEIGNRGTTTNGLIRENFIKARVGFTINDRWFQKPKID